MRALLSLLLLAFAPALPAGKITAVVLHQNGQEMRAPRKAP